MIIEFKMKIESITERTPNLLSPSWIGTQYSQLVCELIRIRLVHICHNKRELTEIAEVLDASSLCFSISVVSVCSRMTDSLAHTFSVPGINSNLKQRVVSKSQRSRDNYDIMSKLLNSFLIPIMSLLKVESNSILFVELSVSFFSKMNRNSSNLLK